MKKNSSKSNRSNSGKNRVRTADVRNTGADLIDDRSDSEFMYSLRERLVEDIEWKTVIPRVLLLLVPALIAFLAGYFLKQDHADFFSWWGLLYIYGWAAFPLTAYFFRGFLSAGYTFAKSFGILLTTAFIWLLSYLGIFNAFNRPMCWIAFFMLAIFSWCTPKTRNAAFSALSDNSNLAHILWEEMLFIALLTVLCFCKGVFPIINGEEKFMNYAFMNSMNRFDGLPAKDPWLAGESINYYYYGQYMFTYLVKMLGMNTEVGYNISMCTAIAFPFISAYGLGQLFIDALRQKKDCQVSKHYLPFAGLLSACCTMIFGNSHSFFYDEQSFGNKMLFWKIWGKLGIDVGETGSFFYPNSTRFIGHNPDLYLQGVKETADWTIHEFPFYSYLIGDLHAHVVSLTVVLLIIAFIFVAVYRAEYPKKALSSMRRIRDLSKNLVSEMEHIFRPEFFICAFFLGISQMCNYWDFLIYFIFCAMGLLVYHGRSSTYLISFSSFMVFLFDLGAVLGVYLKFGENIFVHLCLQILIFMVAYLLSTIFPSAFSRTGTNMAFMFAFSSMIALTFNYNFDMISNSIKLVDRHTSLFQFMIVWLIHVLVPLALIALVVFTKRQAFKRNKLPVTPAPLSLKRPLTYAQLTGKNRTGAFEKEEKPERKPEKVEYDFSDDPDIMDPDFAAEEILNTSEKALEKVAEEVVEPTEEEKAEAEKTPKFILAILCFIRMLDFKFAKLGDTALCKFFRKRSIIDIFMVGMTVVGMMMLIAPEIIYVPDIYGANNQRANTMFKFTFAGFVILSLVVAYTVFRFMAHVTKEGNLSNWGLGVSIVMLVLIIFIPGHYTLRALDQRSGDIKWSTYEGLNGTDYLSTCIPHEKSYYDQSRRVAGAYIPYEEAIDWLNENEKGSVNICESYGVSYTEDCLVSAYTGLPTIVGWETHERLWHFHGWTNPETGEFENDPEQDVFKLYLWPRQNAVATVYTSMDVFEVARVLKEYDVRYIICGSLELDQFGMIYYPCIESLCGQPVFTSSDGSLRIYKVLTSEDISEVQETLPETVPSVQEEA
ncbi:MAG: hypothetical protein IK109_03450 [Clostridiales bacterium]|nr:hypothetical protein [Clostridiales bacterium]